MQRLDDSIQPVKISSAVPVTRKNYNMPFPDIGVLHGKIKYLVWDHIAFYTNDSGTVSKTERAKVPGNCYKYWFDAAGQFSKVQGYFDTVVYFTADFIYNSTHQLRKLVTVGQNRDIDSLVYVHDDNGLLRSVKHYDAGKLTSNKVFNYDNLGRITKEYMRSNYQPLLVQTYFYNGTNTHPDSAVTNMSNKITYEYTDGFLTKVTNASPKTGKWSDQFKYDTAGNLTWELSDIGAIKKEYVYTWDESGNWVKKDEKLDGMLTSFIQRHIEYY